EPRDKCKRVPQILAASYRFSRSSPRRFCPKPIISYCWNLRLRWPALRDCSAVPMTSGRGKLSHPCNSREFPRWVCRTPDFPAPQAQTFPECPDERKDQRPDNNAPDRQSPRSKKSMRYFRNDVAIFVLCRAAVHRRSRADEICCLAARAKARKIGTTFEYSF